MSKLKQRRKLKGQRPLAAARCYTAKSSQLGELALIECCIEIHAKEMQKTVDCLWRIRNRMHDIREEIRTGKAV
jgi:hypothetical protein